MTQFLSETRERFLVAIAEQVPADRIAEVHFFNPIKQGGLESGVAVVALTKPAASGEVAGPGTDDAAAEATGPEDERDVVDAEAGDPVADAGTDHASSDNPAPKHVVLTAHYRLTLKGLDRGKWQVTVVEEADAPLITVETVVRGVQRRAGDLEDPERMDGDAVREALAMAAARSA
jgi:hypothetical protein